MIPQVSEMAYQHCKMINGVKYKAWGSVYVFNENIYIMITIFNL